jgi:hypothetical protein
MTRQTAADLSYAAQPREACDLGSASRAEFIASAPLADHDPQRLMAIAQMPAQDAMDTDPALLARMIEATYAGPALLRGLRGIERQKAARRCRGLGVRDRGRRKNYLYGSAKANCTDRGPARRPSPRARA